MRDQSSRPPDDAPRRMDRSDRGHSASTTLSVLLDVIVLFRRDFELRGSPPYELLETVIAEMRKAGRGAGRIERINQPHRLSRRKTELRLTYATSIWASAPSNGRRNSARMS
jgi:hypothetical protein